MHVIKTAPQGKQSHSYSGSYFKKGLVLHLSPLKNASVTSFNWDASLLQRIQKAAQNTSKSCRQTRPHIHFYFPINSCPARQEFYISCRDTETNSKLNFIPCVAAISVPVLSSPAVFLNLVLETAMDSDNWERSQEKEALGIPSGNICLTVDADLFLLTFRSPFRKCDCLWHLLDRRVEIFRLV